MAGAPPLYGTNRNFVSVSIWNSSLTRWFELPFPACAMGIAPGFALACFRTSSTLLWGDFAFTTSANGTSCTLMIGVMPFTGSTGHFL
jgi:hypothetical protein